MISDKSVWSVTVLPLFKKHFPPDNISTSSMIIRRVELRTNIKYRSTKRTRYIRSGITRKTSVLSTWGAAVGRIQSKNLKVNTSPVYPFLQDFFAWTCCWYSDQVITIGKKKWLPRGLIAYQWSPVVGFGVLGPG